MRLSPAEMHYGYYYYHVSAAMPEETSHVCVRLQCGRVLPIYPRSSTTAPKISPDWFSKEVLGAELLADVSTAACVNVRRQLQDWLEVRGHCGRSGRVGSCRRLSQPCVDPGRRLLLNSGINAFAVSSCVFILGTRRRLSIRSVSD